jgi:hypothetical protein
MTLSSTQKRLGLSLNFDLSAPPRPPAFPKPWPSLPPPLQPAPPGGGLFVGNRQALNSSMMAGKPPHGGRTSTSSDLSVTSYGSMPVANTFTCSISLPSMAYEVNISHSTSSLDLLNINRMQSTSAASGDQKNTTWASPVSAYAPAPVRPPSFTLAPNADHARTFSQQLVLPGSHA